MSAPLPPPLADAVSALRKAVACIERVPADGPEYLLTARVLLAAANGHMTAYDPDPPIGAFQ